MANRADELMQEAAELRDRARKVLDATDGAPTAEDEREFDRLMDRARELRVRADGIEEKRDAIRRREERRIEREEGHAMDNDNEFRAWARDMTTEEADWTERWIRTGDGGPLEERAASQSLGSKQSGGAVSSTGLFPQVERVMKQFGGVRNLRVNRVQTSHGRAMNHPGVDDVGETASIVSEGSTIANTNAIDFFDVQTTPHLYQAGPIKVSRELLMDSEVDIVQIVTSSLFERIGRATEQDYAGSTTQSSTAPNGIVTLSTGAVTMAAGSSNLATQTLRDLFFSVDPAYRRNGEWAVSDSALQAIADLEDTDGRPLVQPSLQAGLDVELFGKPLQVVQDMGDIAASTEFPIAFGDFRRGFLLRDVTNITLQRLDERYAETREVGFMAWYRTDSKARFSSTVVASNRPVRAIRTT